MNELIKRDEDRVRRQREVENEVVEEEKRRLGAAVAFNEEVKEYLAYKRIVDTELELREDTVVLTRGTRMLSIKAKKYNKFDLKEVGGKLTAKATGDSVQDSLNRNAMLEAVLDWVNAK
jgi:hypothetical protein